MIPIVVVDLEEAEETLGSLAKAEFRAVEVEGFGETEDFIAVYNITDDRVSQIVSQRYTILQHQDFFPDVINAIRNLELGVKYVDVKDGREKVFMEFLFDEEFELEEEEILKGFRAGNSFDRTCRAFVGAYGLRQICKNGMMGERLFGSQAQMHIGDMRVEAIIKGLEKTLPEFEAKLQNIIETNKEEKHSVEEAKGLMNKVGLGKKLIKEAVGRLSTESTRWDIYNVATELIDHPEKRVKEGTREYKHDKANKILTVR